MNESRIVMHDEECSLDDLKQENKILRNELTKLCQEITVQSETEENLRQIRDELNFQKLLNTELNRRLIYIEDAKLQLEDRITSYNQHFIEIASYRMKLTYEETAHRETKGKLQSLQGDHNKLLQEHQEVSKVNKNLQRFLKSQQHSMQLKKLADETLRKDKKLHEVKSSYKNSMMLLQAKTLKCNKLEEREVKYLEDIEQLKGQITSQTIKLQSQSKEIVKLHDYVKLLQMKQEFAKDMKRMEEKTIESSRDSTPFLEEEYRPHDNVNRYSKDCRIVESISSDDSEPVIDYAHIYEDHKDIVQEECNTLSRFPRKSILIDRNIPPRYHMMGTIPTSPLTTETMEPETPSIPLDDFVCLDLSSFLFGTNQHPPK